MLPAAFAARLRRGYVERSTCYVSGSRPSLRRIGPREPPVDRSTSLALFSRFREAKQINARSANKYDEFSRVEQRIKNKGLIRCCDATRVYPPRTHPASSVRLS